MAILVGMALPGAAEADTIGSSLFGESTPVGCAENTTCILAQGRLEGDVFNNVVSQDGTITGFTFRHVTGDVKFVVLREEGASGYAVVDSTDAITGSGDDEDEAYTLTPGIPVRQGDFIGLALDQNATVGARDATGEDTNLLELTDSSTPVLAAEDRSAELFLRATWEPAGTDPGGPGTGPIFEDDDDGSFSTAVPDPLAALKAGARPKVKISAKATRASKKYSVAITVRNPNGYRVKGRLSLKAKGLRLGSKAFSIAAESSKAVRVKLSGKARKRLARKRKMKITASASFKGPIGKAGSAKQSITVKAPKRPKPKKRTPSGGGGGGGGLLPRPFCVPHIEYDANGWAHAVPC
jgi:hypothetical protein